MNNRYLAVCFSLFLTGSLFSAELGEYEKGEMVGKLVFGAMTIDAYYEVCVSNGYRTDNHLNGILKLLGDKWGMDFPQLIKEQEDFSGRSYREEAHDLVSYAAKQTGGCSSTRMTQWLSVFTDLHDNNLLSFHSIVSNDQ